MKFAIATSIIILLCYLYYASANDAVKAAENAGQSDSGLGKSFSGSLKQWSAGVGKTVWSSNDGNKRVSVGVGAHGHGAHIGGGQAGINFRMRF